MFIKLGLVSGAFLGSAEGLIYVFTVLFRDAATSILNLEDYLVA